MLASRIVDYGGLWRLLRSDEDTGMFAFFSGAQADKAEQMRNPNMDSKKMKKKKKSELTVE